MKGRSIGLYAYKWTPRSLNWFMEYPEPYILDIESVRGRVMILMFRREFGKSICAQDIYSKYLECKNITPTGKKRKDSRKIDASKSLKKNSAYTGGVDKRKKTAK